MSNDIEAKAREILTAFALTQRFEDTGDDYFSCWNDNAGFFMAELIDLLRPLWRDARNAALEDAAKVAMSIPYVRYEGRPVQDITGTEWVARTKDEIASRIRALKDGA